MTNDKERAEFLDWHNNRRSSNQNAWAAWQARAALAAPAQAAPEDLSVEYFMGLHAENETLHVENDTLRAGYDAARLEIESLKQRVQELGQMARDVNSRRVTELEAQLDAVGAGGVQRIAGPDTTPAAIGTESEKEAPRDPLSRPAHNA